MKKITIKQVNATGLRVGIVQARFNQAITDKLVVGAERALKEAGVRDGDIYHVSVPGALEIPFALDALIDAGELDALVALGAVIKGDTYHFEVVCNESAAGISRIALETGTPVGNGVLTTYTEAQAQERADQKGYEAAQAALELAALNDAISEAMDE
jgi:6,7-dimethyl-8-ribityllumazine synthase